MTIFGWKISVARQRPQIVIAEEPLLTPAQLAGALKGPPAELAVRAVLQIIKKHQDNALENALKTVGQHGLLANYVGGQDFCKRIRDEILEVQQQPVTAELLTK